MKRIHIVGCGPRTGTTLLAEMMTACFDIDLFTDHDARIAMLPPRNGKVFLTKSPKDIIVVEPILKLVKSLHVIYLVRDPRDMIASKHGYHKDRYYSSLSILKRFHPFSEAIKDHPRFLTVKYEDLVQRPDDIQNQIQEVMPFLHRTHLFSKFHEVSKASNDSMVALGSLRPVDSDSIGNWKNHKARVLGQLQKHGPISDFLQKYDYEENDSWVSELEGIEPDLSESYHPFYQRETFIKEKLRFKTFRAIRIKFYLSAPSLWLFEFLYRLKGKNRST